MMGKMKLVGLLGVGVALLGSLAPAAAQECSDGTLGVESGSFDVCCVAACGTCGGSGCGNITGLTAQDCCVEEISLNGTFCVDSSTAPCILSTTAASNDSTCDNGMTGVQDPDTDVCCPLECGDQCGGDGCGSIAGVGPDQCCASEIEEAGIVCGDDTEPPCIQTTVAANDTTCSNGLAGVEDVTSSYCCDAACGTCGGETCGNIAGLTGDDCCSSNIETNGILCSVSGEAPCIIDPPEFNASLCANGLPGVSDGANICCIEACGVCGGNGCGSIAGTGGADDCCSANIADSNVSCVGNNAPCVMLPGSFTPSPVAVVSTTIAPGTTLAPGATPAPSAGSRDVSFTMAPTTVGGSVGGGDTTGVPTAAPTSVEDIGSASPTAGSRDGDFSSAPTAAGVTLSPGATVAPGATLAPGATEAPSSTSGSASVSAGSVVTFVAMVGGMFAVVAAARN